MAKQRMIHTKFWSDPFIQELSANDKLFYLYLLTNEHTEINGVYEISLKTMAYESGHPIQTVEDGLVTLSKAGKIIYVHNYIILRNFGKHQAASPAIAEGVKKANSKLPQQVLEIIDGLGTVGGWSGDEGTLELEYKLKPKLEVEVEPAKRDGGKNHLTPSQTTKVFFLSVLEKDSSFSEMVEKISQSRNLEFEQVAAEFDKFTSYWTELTKDGKRQRWELEKVFEVQRRLATWFSRISQTPFGSRSKPPQDLTII